eukprot:symbB.v1.2.020857.t1/scaffold1711.1/size185425/20
MSDVKPAGMLRVYFHDHTYKTLHLTQDSSVQEVIDRLCQKIGADPNQYELLIIAPVGPLRERKLLLEDRPLRIQEKAGCTAYKFLFRERLTMSFTGESKDEGIVESVDWPLPSVSEEGILQRGELECLTDSGWQIDNLWHSDPEALRLGAGMVKLSLRSFEKVEAIEDEANCTLRIRSSDGESTWRARSSKQRNSWLKILTSQLQALAEAELLAKAQNAIGDIEARRCDDDLARLETFDTVQGLLADPEARELFLWFLSQMASDSENPTAEVDADFAESQLSRFKEHPGIQNRLCRIAAGLGAVEQKDGSTECVTAVSYFVDRMAEKAGEGSVTFLSKSEGRLSMLPPQAEVARWISLGPAAIFARWRTENMLLVQGFLLFLDLNDQFRVSYALSVSSIASVELTEENEVGVPCISIELIVGGRQEAVRVRLADQPTATSWLRRLEVARDVTKFTQTYLPSSLLSKALEAWQFCNASSCAAADSQRQQDWIDLLGHSDIHADPLTHC